MVLAVRLSLGDIAFHYGCWTYTGNYGWLWVPGYEYAPAWVFWRHSEGYCGWAPLPAGALFVGGVWRYNGVRVGVGFDFGLTVGVFTFVAYEHFWEHDYRHYIVPHDRVVIIYRDSHFVNNYRVVNGRVINEGMGRERMAQLTHREVREENLHEIRAREQQENLERRKTEWQRTSRVEKLSRPPRCVASRHLTPAAIPGRPHPRRAKRPASSPPPPRA